MKIILLILLALCLVLLTMLIILLMSPFVVLLDSKIRKFKAGWNRWLYAELISRNQDWWIRFKILAWDKLINVRKLSSFRKKKEVKPQKNKTKSRVPGLRRLRKVLKEIKVSEFKLIIDTDDFVLNAYLTPFFEMIHYHFGYQTRVSFNGESEIRLKLRTRIGKIFMASIF